MWADFQIICYRYGVNVMQCIIKLNHEHITLILGSLPEAVRHETDHDPVYIHVGGGAALVLMGLREETSDIDLFITSRHNSKIEFNGIQRLSAELGIFKASSAGQEQPTPFDWSERNPPSETNTVIPPDLRTTYFTAHHFSVPQQYSCNLYLLNPEILLIQKLNIIMDDRAREYRPLKIEQDIIDAARLCEALGIDGTGKLQKVWEKSFDEFWLVRRNRNIHMLTRGDTERAWQKIADKMSFPDRPPTRLSTPVTIEI